MILAVCVTVALDGAADQLGRAAPAAGAMIVFGAGYAAWRLVRMFRLPARSGPPGPPGRTHSMRWYAIGTGILGTSGLLPLSGAMLGLTDVEVADGMTAAAMVAGAAFVPALLFMPGAAASSAARLQGALDGASVGLCLMFTCWVLLIAPHGHVDSPTFWIAMFTCCVLSTAVIVGLRPKIPSGSRAGAAMCAAGVCGTLLAQLGLAVTLADHLPAAWLLVAGGLLAVSAVLVWRGSSHVWSQPAAASPAASPAAEAGGPGRGTGATARTSVLLIPAVMAVVVALHRLLTGGAFDRAEMMVGTIAAVAVGVRQTLAARVAGVPEIALAPPASATPPPSPALPSPAPTPAREPVPDDLFRRAYVDPVTGLSNQDHLALAVTGMRAAPRCGGALLVIGIGAGGDHDQLRDAAARLRRCCPVADGGTRDLLGRLSDTDFAVLTPNDVAHAYGLAHRIVAALGPRASVGISDLAGAPSTADVLHRARLAADRARETGPGQVEWYDPGMEQAVRLRETVASELPDALRSGELDLIYQPIMDIARDRPLAVEALLRWRHPRLGTLMPADVIPVAEQTGLIGDVGRWVLRQASTQLAIWRAEGRHLSMSINVSPHGLDAGELVADVQAALSDRRLPADSLILEFAEAAIEGSKVVDESLDALRAVGVRTALDAFGTGATSLAHLRRLPIDLVKLDRSFFGAAGPDGAAGAAPVLDVLVGMGRRLGVDVVAQGVELPAEVDVLRRTRCPFGQGHLFARPQPAEHTEAYLDGFAQ